MCIVHTPRIYAAGLLALGKGNRAVRINGLI